MVSVSESYFHLNEKWCSCQPNPASATFLTKRVNASIHKRGYKTVNVCLTFSQVYIRKCVLCESSGCGTKHTDLFIF